MATVYGFVMPHAKPTAMLQYMMKTADIESNPIVSISGVMTRMKGIASSYIPNVAAQEPSANTMTGMNAMPYRPVRRTSRWMPASIAPVAITAVIAPADSMMTNDRSAPATAPRMKTVHSSRKPCGTDAT
jgi:hypothetical protein